MNLYTFFIVLISISTINSVSFKQALYELEEPQYHRGESCTDDLFTSILKDYRANYPFESYVVNTDDGHNLKIFRIQKKGTRMTKGLPIIYFQHGLTGSADDWIVNSEEKSIGLVMANLGYDVWFGNNRGTKYSLGSYKTMSNKKFWDFSFQDMGQYDVPATIEKILSVTGEKNLIYAGHSQGTSQMFAALTIPKIRDYVASKVTKFLALAPIVYLEHQESTLVSDLAKDMTIIKNLSDTFDIYEIMPGACSKTSKQSEFEHAACKYLPQICNLIIGISDANPKYDNMARVPYITYHIPSGSSTQNFYHYAQFVEQSKQGKPVFKMYDRGTVGNLERYGTIHPPILDLTKISKTIKIRGFVGKQDKFGNIQDEEILKKDLLDAGIDYKSYTYENMGHLTFVIAQDPSKLFEDIIREIQEP